MRLSVSNNADIYGVWKQDSDEAGKRDAYFRQNTFHSVFVAVMVAQSILEFVVYSSFKHYVKLAPMLEKIRIESSNYFTKELIFLSSTFTSCTMILGNLSSRRSWYHGRQPEVFLQHYNHFACQDVLELRSRTSKREFSGWNQRFKFWVLRRVFVIQK